MNRISTESQSNETFEYETITPFNLETVMAENSLATPGTSIDEHQVPPTQAHLCPTPGKRRRKQPLNDSQELMVV